MHAGPVSRDNARTLTRDHDLHLRLELVLARRALEEEVRVADHLQPQRRFCRRRARGQQHLLWRNIRPLARPGEEDERQLCVRVRVHM